MLNARMSAATMKTWARFPQTANRILTGMTAILPQDQASSDRLEELGAPSHIIEAPFNLKSLYRAVLTELPEFAGSFDRLRTVLAAATHEGEEVLVFNAFKELQKTKSDLRLIIAPRHPNRGSEVAEMAARYGFSVSLRSADPTEPSDVFVADSLGEMHIWYRIASAAFIGGSLVPKGGHTPFEPAAYGCPIIHGPHIDNFKDAYADIDQAQKIWRVSSAEELAVAFQEAMQTEPEPHVSSGSGERVFAALDRHLAR